MTMMKAITCQVRALADHVLKTDYSGAELREIAVEMADTRALIESEIRRLDGKAKSAERALHQLFGVQSPKDGAA